MLGPEVKQSRTQSNANLVPRACDPWEGNEGSGIIRCRKSGILAKIELRIHFNGQSDSSLKQQVGNLLSLASKLRALAKILF
jgi:hypothetical protein